MACTFSYNKVCPIYKRYIASGDNKYKGELCQGCLWWVKDKKKVS